MSSRFAGFFFPRGGVSGLSLRLFILSLPVSFRAESTLKAGDIVAICGYSITAAALFAFPPSLLAAGINRAAEYPENPFGGLFEEAGIIMTKQHGFEVGQVRNTISRIGQLRSYLPDGTSRLR